MSRDKIYIEDLLVRAILGIEPHERTNLQDIIVNLILYVDIRKAGISDQIDDCVNYRSIKKRIFKLVEESQFFLVEKLVNEIARVILTEYPVEKVQVRVDKPGALRFAKSVGIEIERTRLDFE